MCHANKDPGEAMGIAGASVCMQCHSAIKADSPAIQKVAEAARTAKPLKWRRVYEIPTYVFFSHRTHLNAENTCEDCHGPVAQRDVLAREADISMKGCMTCHTAKKASNDCTTCHDQRN
jgi:c(7)-type cytochrome triheme protein